jgi:hypothetical protein
MCNTLRRTGKVPQAEFMIDLTVSRQFIKNWRKFPGLDLPVAERERSRIGLEMECLTAGFAVVFALLAQVSGRCHSVLWVHGSWVFR